MRCTSRIHNGHKVIISHNSCHNSKLIRIAGQPQINHFLFRKFSSSFFLCSVHCNLHTLILTHIVANICQPKCACVCISLTFLDFNQHKTASGRTAIWCPTVSERLIVNFQYLSTKTTKICGQNFTCNGCSFDRMFLFRFGAKRMSFSYFSRKH